jgi:hypothetical protein
MEEISAGQRISSRYIAAAQRGLLVGILDRTHLNSPIFTDNMEKMEN